MEDYRKIAIELGQTLISKAPETRKDVERMLPELKESEDEKIKRELIDFFKGVHAYPDFKGIPFERVVAYLEKHIHTDFALENEYWRGYDDAKKQGEKKPDKIEPKFHEGEWITNGDYTWKIVEIKPLDYILQSQDGNIVNDTISHVDEQFHSFTIKDAKDGDVVVDKSDGTVGIFQSIGHHPDGGSCNDPSYCFLHCRYDDGYFYEDFENGNTMDSDDVIPATKEQRDLLFQKMKEAGYEWNAEKKELKKVEQKPQRMVSAEAKEAMYDKPAWSEEDEKFVHGLIRGLKAKRDIHGHITFSSNNLDITKTIEWLESLKERYCPQKQWKPTEEQIRVVARLRYCLLQDVRGNDIVILDNLLEQLKAL